MMALRGRVLVVEGAALVRQAVSRGLSEAGYVLFAAPADDDVGSVIDTFGPDVIVARMGSAPAEQVRYLRRGMETPVIFLACDEAPPDLRVQARRAGAASVFVEPIHIDEVVARVDSLIEHRRTHRVVSVYDLTIDVDAHVVRRNDVDVQLTATEFNLLLHLVENAGLVLSKRQLLEQVWGFDEYDVNVVEAHTSALRRKLETAGPRLIQTVRGFGYVLRWDVTPGTSADAGRGHLVERNVVMAQRPFGLPKGERAARELRTVGSRRNDQPAAAHHSPSTIGWRASEGSDVRAM